MKLNIFDIVVVLLATQGALGKPSLISGLVGILTGSTVAATTITPSTVTDINSIPVTTADGVIQSAIDVTKQLVTYSNTVLKQLAADTTTSVTNKIAVANQVIANASTIESGIVEYISNGLESIVDKSYTDQAGKLDDKIAACTNAITNVSAILHNSNIKTFIGAALTNVTNSALGNAGDELAKHPTVILFANAVKTLSKIDVLNELVDKIANLTNVPLDLIATPTDFVTRIRNIYTDGADLTDQINNAFEAGVKDLSTVTIPLTPTINNTVTDIISALDNGVVEITAVINGLQNTTPGIVAATETAFAKIALVLVQSAVGSSGILSNIIGSLSSTVAGLISAIQTLFPTLATLLNVFNGTAGQSLAANFLLCVTNEISTLQNYKAQHLSLIDEWKTGIANGYIIGSTVENTIKLTADVALALEMADFKIYDCETIQAATTANVVLPAVKTIVSLLV